MIDKLNSFVVIYRKYIILVLMLAGLSFLIYQVEHKEKPIQAENVETIKTEYLVNFKKNPKAAAKDDGKQCETYTQEAMVDGKKAVKEGIVCKDENGRWVFQN